jgi:Baseplate J-like protein
MSCTGKSDCLCGCCSGTSVETPQVETNPPGLSSIAFRAGTWTTFKESMLARLSTSDYPALAALKTREDDDFTIAFLDATATVLDILTFYQERLANESYLRTATQLRSLTELSRLIGYQPAPGVSASVYLAFTLKAAPGLAPDPSTPPITIPQGSQVQSVPVQGQKPQTFETSAAIQAKADWNALPVQTAQPWTPPGSNGVYLSGTSTQLQTGDSLLILGVDRETWNPAATPDEQWDVVVLNRVETDAVRNLTYVAWDKRLSHVTGDGTSGSPSNWSSAKIFALRQKAALFGHNAPNPNLFVNSNAPAKTSLPALINDASAWQWYDFQTPSSSQIDLDAAYPKIAVGSWFALVRKSFAEFRIFLRARLGVFGALQPAIYEAQLYKVQQAAAVSLAKFALSGKVTELTADYADPNIAADFPLQSTEVWAQSEELPVGDQPLTYPLYGRFLDLQDLRPDLVGAKVVAVSGNRQKITVADGVTTLSFDPDDGSVSMTLNPGDKLTLTGPAPLPLNTDFSVPDWSSFTAPLTLNVEDASGRPGTVKQASLSDFSLAPSGSSDPEVSEYALVTSVSSVTAPYSHTRILLQSNLVNCYDRNTTTVNANVGLATHGQSVSEVLGSGSASSTNQSFTLKQTPLTFIQAPTPTGRQSTLQVQANGMTWTEVPSLYNEPPSQQVFATLNQPDGSTTVQFGDAVEGATLPTGQSNIHANYRIGSGSQGNVGTGTLTTLMDRPLGVSGVTNPAPASGGQDPETIDDLRTSAPQTVLTLGRAVSITDYQSYASTFAGIAKAHAIWIPNGPGRGVFLTVAGVNGAALPPGNPTLANLVASLHNFGNPLIPITARSFLETLFGLSADLQYDPKYDAPTVKAAVLQALSQTYSFAARTFGQGVSVDEIAAAIQAVPGVAAVNVTGIHIVATSAGGDLAGMAGGFTLSNLNNWLAQQVTLPRPFSDSPSRICAYLPVAATLSVPLPAEILVLDPDPKSVVLGVMS